MPDKFTAVWISHSSINDFLKCPRSYFLKSVYKSPQTGHKIKLMTPPLALGQVVHEVLESLSVIPAQNRFKESLIEKFNQAWKKVSGKNGGFFDFDTETKYKNRGEEMIRRITNFPGPLKEPAVKIQENLPFYWLSESDNIILCGKIDWLEYLPETDSVNIIDFKTSRSNAEEAESLQLPIYHLLVHNCQKRKVTKASYWYLDRSNTLEDKPLPDLQDSYEKILKIGKQIKLARQLERFKCPYNGCPACKPLEKILAGEAEFVGHDEYKTDIYILNRPKTEDKEDSIIL